MAKLYKPRKTKFPYTLVMGAHNMGHHATLQSAIDKGRSININRVRSSGGEKKAVAIKVYYEQVGEEQRLVHIGE